MNFIPLVDLKAQYSTIKDEINTAIQSVINDSAFVKGRFVKTFEDSFAEKNGVKYCIGVANGTDAIYIALRALGIGPGDEVITTAFSWISTAETIQQTGANPVFSFISLARPNILSLPMTLSCPLDNLREAGFFDKHNWTSDLWAPSRVYPSSTSFCQRSSN